MSIGLPFGDTWSELANIAASGCVCLVWKGDKPGRMSVEVRLGLLQPSAFPTVNDWAREVARITRAAFSAPGRAAAGLPPPSGAEESPENVLGDLSKGASVWIARLPSGEAIGTVRIVPAGDGVWELKRLGVVPSFRGQGIARRLVESVEGEAARAGVRRVRLYCVVERLLPPYYAQLGYRIVERRAHADKPLTVVTMERDPAAPRRAYPSAWEAEQSLPSSGVYAIWLWLSEEARLPVPRPGGSVLRRGLYAYVGSAQRNLAARLARHVRGARTVRWHVDDLRRRAEVVGVDVWPGAPREQECRMAAALAGYAQTLNGQPARAGRAEVESLARPRRFGASDCECPGHLVYFGPHPEQVEPFSMPRRLEPGLLAVMRLPMQRDRDESPGRSSRRGEPS